MLTPVELLATIFAAGFLAWAASLKTNTTKNDKGGKKTLWNPNRADSNNTGSNDKPKRCSSNFRVRELSK